MKIISTEKAPAAIGAYSQAVSANGFVYTSGQIPIDPSSSSITAETIEAQTEQAIKNLSAVLDAAGSGLGYVVKTTCFITDMDSFSAFNEVYAKHFTGNPREAVSKSPSCPKALLLR